MRWQCEFNCSRRFFVCGNLVAVSNTTGCLFPVWKSCSFLAIDYYEEASSNFEEYLTEALIPEHSCLLNDVCYPLNKIDEFYKAPWISAEYDAEFLSKEAEKVEETILKLCANVPPIHDFEDISLNEETFPNSDYLFEAVKFEEQNLRDLREECECTERYELLEVPQIPFQLKTSDIPLKDLVKNIPLMELEDIFEKEIPFPLEDLETTFECSPASNEKNKFLRKDEEIFEEMVLPKIPDDDISYEHLSFDSKRSNSLYKTENEWENRNIYFNEGTKMEKDFFHNGGNFSPHSDQLSLFSDPMTKDCNNRSSPTEGVVVYSTNDENGEGIPLKESKLQTLVTKPSISNCVPQTKICETDKNIVSNDHFLSNKSLSVSKCHDKEENCDNFLELCNDDVFAENFFHFTDWDKSATDQHVLPDSIIVDVHKLNLNIPDNSSKELKDSNALQSCGTHMFRDKLSKLEFIKTNDMFKTSVFSTKESQRVPESTIKCSTVHRDRTSFSQKSLCENKDNTTQKNLHKSQNVRSFNLLSSFLHARKKESGELWSTKSSRTCSQMSVNSNYESHEMNMTDFKNTKDENAPNFKKKLLLPMHSSENEIPRISDKVIVLKFPDNYMELISIYETATIYYIQKLLPWKGFNVSSDLTIVDISQDKTRFLLNQELKNCRDQNVIPLEGGIGHSYYIQLLILHGILKSLNCFIHFGAQLAISSLSEFEKKHAITLKGCFDDLIYKISNFIIENLSLGNSVHPKMKEICTFLLEKYYFCKENIIPFKVLIIVKEHLSSFHQSFQAFMKTLLPEIAIDLIPESCYLQQENDYFSGNDDHIFTVCVSSISRDMLWKHLTLVIEYDTYNNASWKMICNQENVAHVCVKLSTLPLKTLEEIKNLPQLKEPFHQTCKESRQMPVVVSNSISFKYGLQRSLDKEQNISLYERSYENFLPHLHFADVTIDLKTALTIVSMVSFLNDGFLNSIVDKMFSLQLKYEICWIIIHNNLIYKNLSKECLIKIQSCYYKFYNITVNMKTFQSFKVKFLYAKSDEDIVKWIHHILSKNLKITLNKLDCYPMNYLSADMSEEELFLMSFPSLNPIVVAFILSSKVSFSQLMNLTLEELCSKFCYVPGRFLKHFHRLSHETVHLEPKPSKSHQRMFGSPQNDAQNTSYFKEDFFHTQLNSNSGGVVEFINQLENDRMGGDEFGADFDASLTPTFGCESQSNDSSPFNYSEMSVEEIDRNYRALQRQDIESASLDVGSVHNSPVDGVFSSGTDFAKDVFLSQPTIPSPKRRKKYHDSRMQENDDFAKESCSYSLNELPYGTTHSYQDTKYPTVPSLSSRIKSKCSGIHVNSNMKLSESLHEENENSKSPKAAVKELNLSQFMYGKKRKLTGDFSNPCKSVKYSSQSSIFSSSSRIQKGQSSKTVCKETWFKNIPGVEEIETEMNRQRLFPSSSFSQNCTSQLQPFSDKVGDFVDELDSRHSERIDSPWMSQGSITLTPRQRHRLSYEKIPGKKGQTRLVFH